MAAIEWKRQNLAYQSLTEVPTELIEQEGGRTAELDLTHNKISDLRFLIDYPQLTTLILDHNQIGSHVKMPSMNKLHTLWLNHNKITNLSTFIATLVKSCPNLRHLSMMNNEAAPSFFNGGTFQQYMDYRYFVISRLKKLDALDDKIIQENERAEAERIYGRSKSRRKSTKKKMEQDNT
ncbi:leucine-rich melanocyte differentiation-associated protein-like [Ylistrum balloti]|uniref:leucine-rich melanocyte differentiation-associated protein-like n=1 Tax=Ylistrum balloti TaxID=509963 RepID=UPI0029058D27|nr:leucine-rich melanocyte differentiation-associated protein-like [Ylistrum balloti]